LENELAQFKEDIEQLGILSLANSNNNLLMWAHYTQDHKGMCLEFQRLPESSLADDKQTRKINYTDKHPTLSAKSLKDPKQIESSKRRILFAKSEDWAYEGEWRHIVDKGDQLYPWPAPLKAVYFGCKTSEQDINLVKKVIIDPKVKFYRAELNATKFGMTFKPI